MGNTLVIPQHVANKLTQRGETCGTCRWRHKPNTPGNPDVECRAHPPTASLNMIPVNAGPVARPGMQGMQLQTFSIYPLIKDEMWCGEWTPKPEALS